MTSLNSSKTSIQPEVGLQRADRFIHHVQWDYPLLRQEVAAWEAQRNAQQVRVNWRFTTQDARIKLKRLYPVLEHVGADNSGQLAEDVR